MEEGLNAAQEKMKQSHFLSWNVVCTLKKELADVKDENAKLRQIISKLQDENRQNTVEPSDSFTLSTGSFSVSS